MTSFDDSSNSELHDAIESTPTNTSGNRSFTEVAEIFASRRKVLKGGLALAATSFFASPLALAAKGGKKGPNGPVGVFKDGLVNFEPVPLGTAGPVPTISPDYRYETLIPWGESLDSSLPSWQGDPNTRPSAAEQLRMIGIGHDGMHFFPMEKNGNEHGLLAINHEFGNNSHVLGKGSPSDLEDVQRSQHAHGISIVEIKKENGSWSVVRDSRYGRRITPNTPVTFSGPAAGADVIYPEAGAKGTLNNCSNGFTPWGTYLTCEENFNGYFGTTNFAWRPDEEQNRYGINNFGFGYNWFRYDDRFDLSYGPGNEDNRFGWVVEIDPMAPHDPPVKRTALGRFKHEGVALTIGRGGRAVAYMGDDQRFDYIYKFVSRDNWKSMRAQGLSPLDHGKLYVARFNEDGSGDWLELTIDNPAIAARFASQAEVLTYARIAADILGATPMDRPEWTSVAPNGDVYCTLTNNSRRGTGNNPGADAANPLAPNSDGHIIRWRDSDQHTGSTFSWDIFVIAQDTHGTDSSFADPDGLWVDPDGRVFVLTDGGQKDGLNNQLVIGSIYDDQPVPTFHRLFTGVTQDEITGVAYTPDRKTLFVNTQHPGSGNPRITNFPAPQDGVSIPRDCTCVITRKDGGIVGS